MNIMGKEYGDISCFETPRYSNLCISLSIKGLSSFWIGKDPKNGDLSITCKSPSMVGHAPISSLRLNAFLLLDYKS